MECTVEEVWREREGLRRSVLHRDIWMVKSKVGGYAQLLHRCYILLCPALKYVQGFQAKVTFGNAECFCCACRWGTSCKEAVQELLAGGYGGGPTPGGPMRSGGRGGGYSGRSSGGPRGRGRGGSGGRRFQPY